MAEAVMSPPDGFAGLLTGSLAYCAGALSLDDTGREFTPASDLLRPPVLNALVDGFGAAYEGGDRRAVASLWSQWYFGALLVPATAVMLLDRRVFPLRLDQLGVAMDPERHHAVAFHLPGTGNSAPDADPFELFHDLVWNHLDPLIRSISRSARVSERLLWSNAGGYVEWTVRQLEGRPDGAAAAAAGDRLLAARCWPDGSPNPLFHPVLYVPEGETRVRRRRICCMRYMLPGVGGCGGVCPLARVRGAC